MRTSFVLLMASMLFGCAVLADQGHSGLLCGTCRGILDTVYGLLTSDSFNSVMIPTCIQICSFFKTYEYCEQAVTTFTPVLGALTDMLNSTVICSRLSFCSDPLIVLDSDAEYVSRVLRSVPPRQVAPQISNVSGSLRVLVFTDAHIDFDYQENKSIHCQFTVCCRKDSYDTNKTEERAGPFGHVGSCDLPIRTLDTFIDKLVELNPDVVLWLGDNPGHNTYEQRRETQTKPVNYIADRLRKEFKGKVYAIAGNHDSLPDGQFDVRHGKNHWVIEAIANATRSWLSQESYESMMRYGRMSELVPGTRLRIIGLNHFGMDFTNTFLWANSTDPFGQLTWLEAELQKAETRGEGVIIMGHAPTQSKSAERTFGYRYSALAERYANTIRGHFYGHVHEDYFYLLRKRADPSQTIGVVNVHSCLTTFPTMFPSFRMYYVDRNDFRLLDYDQYRLNVFDANRERKANWFVSFHFKDYYEVKSMEPTEFVKIYQRMKTDHEYLKKVYKAHYADGPKSNPPTDPQSINTMLCRYYAGNFYEFDSCLNGTYSSTGDYFRYVVACKTLFPAWRRAIPNDKQQ